MKRFELATWMRRCSSHSPVRSKVLFLISLAKQHLEKGVLDSPTLGLVVDLSAYGEAR